MLVCVAYGEPYVEFTWTHSGFEEMNSNSSRISIYEEDNLEEGILFRQSFLQLCSVQLGDAGAYTCSVTNGRNLTYSATTQLTISG